MHGTEIIQPIYDKMLRGRAADLNCSERSFSSMKKIFKALAAHFALYGQYMTENMGL